VTATTVTGTNPAHDRSADLGDERQHRLDTFDGELGQLSLGAFDEALDDLAPIADPQVAVPEPRLDTLAAAAVALEELTLGEPTFTADEWDDLDPEAKPSALIIRLKTLRGTLADRFDEDDKPDDPLRGYH
jgi:hypothetical protein